MVGFIYIILLMTLAALPAVPLKKVLSYLSQDEEPRPENPHWLSPC